MFLEKSSEIYWNKISIQKSFYYIFMYMPEGGEGGQWWGVGGAGVSELKGYSKFYDICYWNIGYDKCLVVRNNSLCLIKICSIKVQEIIKLHRIVFQQFWIALRFCIS